MKSNTLFKETDDVCFLSFGILFGWFGKGVSIYCYMWNQQLWPSFAATSKQLVVEKCMWMVYIYTYIYIFHSRLTTKHQTLLQDCSSHDNPASWHQFATHFNTACRKKPCTLTPASCKPSKLDGSHRSKQKWNAVGETFLVETHGKMEGCKSTSQPVHNWWLVLSGWELLVCFFSIGEGKTQKKTWTTDFSNGLMRKNLSLSRLLQPLYIFSQVLTLHLFLSFWTFAPSTKNRELISAKHHSFNVTHQNTILGGGLVADTWKDQYH